VWIHQGVKIEKPAAMQERTSSGTGDTWVILTVISPATVTGAWNQFRAPPFNSVLLDAFRIAYDRTRDRANAIG
jgi:hypothetical protein